MNRGQPYNLIFFHSMENFFAIFPHNGRNVSTLWKTVEQPFSPQRTQRTTEIFTL